MAPAANQQTQMESVSGYVTPKPSATPKPTNYAPGSILSAKDINGYSEALRISSDALRQVPLPWAMAAVVTLLCGAVLL